MDSASINTILLKIALVKSLEITNDYNRSDIISSYMHNSIFVTTILPKIWDSELVMTLNFQILISFDPKLALHTIACRLFMKYLSR